MTAVQVIFSANACSHGLAAGASTSRPYFDRDDRTGPLPSSSTDRIFRGAFFEPSASVRSSHRPVSGQPIAIAYSASVPAVNHTFEDVNGVCLASAHASAAARVGPSPKIFQGRVP